jgi:cellulose/xylan binding protein with CBM9 domain
VRNKFAINTLLAISFPLWICGLRLFWGPMDSLAKPGASASQIDATNSQFASMDHLTEFTDKDAAVAIRTEDSTIENGFPSSAAWLKAHAFRFSADWRGKNADPLRETEVRLLWTADTFFLQFRAKYRAITVFSDSDPNGRRDQLWERDVAEVFLQPDASVALRYKEFEIGPNGFWIDLDIAGEEKWDLKSGLRRRSSVDEQNKIWTAELAIPFKSLVAKMDPLSVWRVNFYRVEGSAEPRFYSAWRPTNTPQPNFHVPEAFGRLVFAPTPVAAKP